MEAKEAAAHAARKRQRDLDAKEQVAEKLRREWQHSSEEANWQASKKRKDYLEEENIIMNMRAGQSLVKVRSLLSRAKQFVQLLMNYIIAKYG